MKKNHIIVVILLTTSLFAPYTAAETTTIDLQDFTETLIDNKWQDFSAIFGSSFSRFHSSKPYSTVTTDGLGSITLSPIVNFNDNSHIHVSGGDGNPSTPTIPFIHGDVGGVFIDGTGSLDTFSFQSMDIISSSLQSNNLHPHPTITVRGFLGGTNNMLTGITEADGTTLQYNGGSQVAEATLSNGSTGTFDFLAADPGFAEVDYIEFFFTDFYREKPSSTASDTTLEFKFDNIVITAVSDTPPTPPTPPPPPSDELSPTAKLPPIPTGVP